MKVLLFGFNGTMGKLTLEKLLNEGYEVIKKEKGNTIVPEEIKGCDYAIDFSIGEESYKHASVCNNSGVPILICATGQSQKVLSKISKIKANVPIVVCSNTTMGAKTIYNWLNTLNNNKKNMVVHIHESHNIHKKDSPSGTSLAYKQIFEDKNISCEISSERTNTRLTSHTISLFLENEIIKITHITLNKEVFAEGAIKLASLLKNMPPKVYLNYLSENFYEET
ncbi:MAG: hypothetical protein IJT25_02790 [Clostridia bacterium]|nr:hypothetical protein [Clostridia bacterium]